MVYASRSNLCNLTIVFVYRMGSGQPLICYINKVSKLLEISVAKYYDIANTIAL